MQKIDMGIAVVCMTNHTAVKLQTQNNLTDYQLKSELLIKEVSISQYQNECPNDSSMRRNLHQDGEFVWSDKTKGFILSAYFYGYILMQVRFIDKINSILF